MAHHHHFVITGEKEFKCARNLHLGAQITGCLFPQTSLFKHGVVATYTLLKDADKVTVKCWLGKEWID